MIAIDLKTLSKMQYVLDQKIIDRHNLHGQDLTPNLWMSFKVELGELANEARFWKHWSKDRKPRVKEPVICSVCEGSTDMNIDTIEESAESNIKHEYIPCTYCKEGIEGYKNPLLEEYVDCLHFLLSIHNNMAEQTNVEWLYCNPKQIGNKIDHFEYMFNLKKPQKVVEWLSVMDLFVGLGEILGFTWSEVEKSYKEKNAINRQRQEENY